MLKPLENIRILDFTQFLAGNWCSVTLSGLGAECIKIERPGTGDPARATPPFSNEDGEVSLARTSPDDLALAIIKRCRNKKGITLNIQTKEGQEIFWKLLEEADVVVENFKPGVMEKCGLTWEKMHAANPKVIYCSINGFGEIDAYKSMPAFDIVIQAMTGAMYGTGFPDGPPLKNGIGIADQGAGLYGTIGILAALIQREKTGLGQKVGASMMEAVLSLFMDENIDFWENMQGLTYRSGNRLTRMTPFNCYKAKDGYFVIASGGDHHWKKILEAAGRQDLLDDDRYDLLPKRVAAADECDAIVQAWADTITVVDACTALEKGGVPNAPVRTPQQVWADKNLWDYGAFVDLYTPDGTKVEGITGTGFPIRMSACDLTYDKPAPHLGENNDEFYKGLLKLSDAKLADLKAKGAI